MDLNSLISTLLTNRGLTSPAAVSEFFHPPDPLQIPLSAVGLKPASIDSAVQLIKQHISRGHQIAVYGDYDVDGICSTAILWENLHRLTPHVFPHIPHRREEGYGLTRSGIDACLASHAQLIITVDNGIVAKDQIAYAKGQGCDVIVIDHHESGPSLPAADAILHSTATCAAGLTWFFCRELIKSPSLVKEGDTRQGEEVLDEQLSLVALAVVCDIIPLLGLNRSLVRFGLDRLKTTRRPGLLALFNLARINPANLDTYHLGFVIGPRLNAMGRLEHALDSLRLLCTTSPSRAAQLAQTLEATNRFRQQLTTDSTLHAVNQITAAYPHQLPKLLFVSDPSYDQGIIGLIAAKLVEKFYRPAIAVSVGDADSKASVRSVPGFHITDFLRSSSDLLVTVGGHSLAAGFTVLTRDLPALKDQIVSQAESLIPENLLTRTSKYDLELPGDFFASGLNLDLASKLAPFAPFGLGNPEPAFFTRAVPISDPRRLGTDGRHLRFTAGPYPAIWFSAPPDVSASPLDIIYRLGVDTYHQPDSLQLVIKDIPAYASSR